MRVIVLLAAALLASIATAQPTVTSTRIESAEWTCRDDMGAVLSTHTRADKAQEACSNRALAEPGKVFELRPSGYRITATVPATPATQPEPDPEPQPDPDPEPETQPEPPTAGEFPDSSTTGWRHTGVTLTAHTGSCNLSTAGATYDGKRFNCNVTISADNVTLKRSEINGVVRLARSNMRGILLEDVYVDGQNASGNAGGQCIGGNASSPGGATAADFIIRRAEILGCEQGVYGRGWTLEDSYIHNLYCAGQDHTEAILGHTGKIVARGNNIVNKLRASTCSGGGQASAVIALYTHSSFWPDMDDVLFERNRIENGSGRGEGGYCVYGGDGSAAGASDNGNATNTRFIGNVLVRGPRGQCGAFGAVVGIADGAGSCGRGNVYDDGTAIRWGRECTP